MGFDLTTLVLLLVLAPIVIWVGWRRPFEVLAALVLILPFRDFSIRILNAFTNLSVQTVNSLSRWWFVVILALLIVWATQGVMKLWNERRLPNISWLDITLGLIFIVGIVEAFLSPNRLAGITSLRGYLQPLAVFVLARAFQPADSRQLRKFNLALSLVGLSIFIFALWQFLTWTSETYATWGYQMQDNVSLTALPLDINGRRILIPVSTVSGPRELGTLFSIYLFVPLFWALFARAKGRLSTTLLTLVFMSGLLLTYSRSAFVGLIVSLGFFLVYLIRHSGLSLRKLSPHQRIAFAGGILFSFLLVFGIMVAIGMDDRILLTLTGLSEEPHIVEIVNALRFIPNNLGGVGMGMVSPKGALALINTKPLFHAEGSVFQIALEWGIWGFVLWAMFWTLTLSNTWRKLKTERELHKRIILGTSFMGWIGALITFVFLPLMQSVNLMVFLWFLLGLGVGQRSDA